MPMSNLWRRANMSKCQNASASPRRRVASPNPARRSMLSVKDETISHVESTMTLALCPAHYLELSSGHSLSFRFLSAPVPKICLRSRHHFLRPVSIYCLTFFLRLDDTTAGPVLVLLVTAITVPQQFAVSCFTLALLPPLSGIQIGLAHGRSRRDYRDSVSPHISSWCTLTDSNSVLQQNTRRRWFGSGNWA